MSFCFIYLLYVPNTGVGTLVSMSIPIQQRDSKISLKLGCIHIYVPHWHRVNLYLCCIAERIPGYTFVPLFLPALFV